MSEYPSKIPRKYRFQQKINLVSRHVNVNCVRCKTVE